MNALYELTIVRTKLVITQLREMTPHDLVGVRETLNSIDFIMGDDDIWDYKTDSKGCRAITKLRLQESENILNFIKENKDKLMMDSIDQAFLTDITQVYKIDRSGKTKQEVKSIDLNAVVEGNKRRITQKINDAVANINALAETMGGIL